MSTAGYGEKEPLEWDGAGTTQPNHSQIVIRKEKQSKQAAVDPIGFACLEHPGLVLPEVRSSSSVRASGMSSQS